MIKLQEGWILKIQIKKCAILVLQLELQLADDELDNSNPVMFTCYVFTTAHNKTFLHTSQKYKQ